MTSKPRSTSTGTGTSTSTPTPATTPPHKIGVLTSGGDAPGMNAAIRSVVRTAITSNMEVVGIYSGYAGLLQKRIQPLTLSSVANIIQRGGTILKTARCPEFLRAEVRAQAAQNLKALGIQGLIVIGGDGTFTGGHLLSLEQGIQVVGIPGTIDNDIYGTEESVGFDTALNTALEAIDRIRDTAASHDRLFIVEVMGRDSGFIAIDVGVAGGAEEVFIPENLANIDNAIQAIKRGIERGKSSSILVAAEGQKVGRAYDLAEQIRRKAGFEAKVCVLGHIQRGGPPTARDRILASRLGFAAVRALQQGLTDIMVGVQSGQIVPVNLKECTTRKRRVPNELIELAHLLAH
ncbi:MAG: 6-phosphofructokinase [Candidatus Competibacteraceae bacterium]|nr:6-phosphofructokinase [Candidatus Competibacteraceae bacterium]